MKNKKKSFRYILSSPIKSNPYLHTGRKSNHPINKVRLSKSRHANLCSKNQFFRENIVGSGVSELRPGTNERYENSIFYGPFKFLIFILIFNKKQFCQSVQ